MSEIWICQSKTADHPFFLEEENINLYSMEELCYYLHKNIETLDEQFFNEKLLIWMEEELGLAELCEELREGISQGKDCFWCLEMILWESGYYTREELEKELETVVFMIQAKPEERKKLRADNMLLEGKYKGAVREYQQLLQQESTEQLLEGKIWHNMGTAYARQFLFARAAKCYEKAYTLSGMEESRQQYLLALAWAEGEAAEDGECVPENNDMQQLEKQERAVGCETEVYQKVEELAKEYVMYTI